MKTLKLVSTHDSSVESLPRPKKLESLVGKDNGTKPAQGFSMVPVDLPNHMSQRPLKPIQITKWALESNGFDWNLFGYITVVCNSDGVMTKLNGQQRCQMCQWLLPDVKEVPAHIIYTDSDAYAATLFYQMNDVNMAQLTGEELLWAEIIAERPQALYVKEYLEAADLSCGMFRENDTEYKTKRAIFERSLKYSEEGTLAAVDLIREAYSKSKLIDGQVMCGLARLFSIKSNGEYVYDNYANTNTRIGKLFKEWFIQQAYHRRLKDLHYDNYKNLNASSAWENGCAYGLAKDFTNWLGNKGLRRLAQPLAPVKNVYESRNNNQEMEV